MAPYQYFIAGFMCGVGLSYLIIFFLVQLIRKLLKDL